VRKTLTEGRSTIINQPSQKRLNGLRRAANESICVVKTYNGWPARQKMPKYTVIKVDTDPVIKADGLMVLCDTGAGTNIINETLVRHLDKVPAPEPRQFRNADGHILRGGQDGVTLTVHIPFVTSKRTIAKRKVKTFFYTCPIVCDMIVSNAELARQNLAPVPSWSQLLEVVDPPPPTQEARRTEKSLNSYGPGQPTADGNPSQDPF
jgi:hypothetical protein